MILRQLLDEITKTMPVLGMSVIFTLAQMCLGAVLPVLTMFRVVRRRSKGEIFLCCMVPIVLIVTTAIVEPLFFGSFLGDGFPEEHMRSIRGLIGRPEFFYEVIAVCGGFLVCSVLFLLLDHFVGKTSVVKILLNMGLEYLFMIAAAVICWDYLYREGAYFSSLSDPFIKWGIYGLYLLLSKSAFYLVCFVFALLFGEREPEYKFGRYESPEKWLRGYFSRSYRSLGLAFLAFSVFWFFLAVYPIFFEEEINVRSYWLVYVFCVGFELLPAVFGAIWTFYALVPQMLPNYRRILKWGHPEQMTRLIYRELVGEKALEELRTGMVFVTPHFVVLNFPRRIFYLPLYERRVEAADSCCKLYFRDGSHFRIQNTMADMVLRQCRKIQSQEWQTIESGGK